MARRLGVSQSALSKLENGTLIPSASLWVEFCRLVQIPTDCLLDGYVDRVQPMVLKDFSRIGSYKLPQQYALHQGSKVRSALPIIEYCRKELGQKKTEQLFESMKMDPDYFIDLDHGLNLQFFIDLFEALIKKDKLRPEDLESLSAVVARPESHGNLHRFYDDEKGRLNRMRFLLSNANLYECNFKYTVFDEGSNHLDFAIAPESHLSAFSYRNHDVLGDFLCTYKKKYFEGFLGYSSVLGKRPEHAAVITEKECHYHGAKSCVYHVEVQSA